MSADPHDALRDALRRIGDGEAEGRRFPREDFEADLAEAQTLETSLARMARDAIARNDPDERASAAVDLAIAAEGVESAFDTLKRRIEAHVMNLRLRRSEVRSAILPLVPEGPGGKIEGTTHNAVRAPGKITPGKIDHKKLPPRYWEHPEPTVNTALLGRVVATGAEVAGVESVKHPPTIGFRKKKASTP